MKHELSKDAAAILALRAIGLAGGMTYDEALEVIVDVYIMGREDERKDQDRTSRMVEQIKRSAFNG